MVHEIYDTKKILIYISWRRMFLIRINVSLYKITQSSHPSNISVSKKNIYSCCRFYHFYLWIIFKGKVCLLPFHITSELCLAHKSSYQISSLFYNVLELHLKQHANMNNVTRHTFSKPATSDFSYNTFIRNDIILWRNNVLSCILVGIVVIIHIIIP